jgi:signal transduction histidine kinase
MKNWKISTKLIAVLIAPLVVLAGLAAVGISARRTEASNAARAQDLSELAAKGSALIHGLQNETIFSAANQAAGEDAVAEPLAAARANTDEALVAYEEALADLTIADDEASFQNAVDSAATRINDIETIRTAVDGSQTDMKNAVVQLSDTSDALLAVNQEIATAVATPELSDALDNYVEFSRSKQAAGLSAALLAGVLERSDPRFQQDGETLCEEGQSCAEFVAFSDAISEEDQRRSRFNERATGDQKSLLRNATSTPEVRDAEAILDAALLAGQGLNAVTDEAPGLQPSDWLQAGTDKLFALLGIEEALVSEIVTQAVDLRNEAQTQLQVFLVVAVLAILISVILALIVARATARPLQRLTVAANRLSTEQLPGLVEQLRNPDSEGSTGFAAQLQPIDIHSKDEIGQLADAFNTIQQVTLEVAEEQASLLRKGIGDIFINLARRNQTLLDRQIEFIDQLEANEEDPDQLDNLFKLDHLATRMRRNAESLLVLAGAEPPRRRGRPVALADVVRVAIGEVEDFARISLLALDEAMVGGNVAVDLAHLLSELMENATHFSPPDTHVEVIGRIEPDGSYVLTVTDQGIGMSSEQLTEANHQLATPPLVGLALSRSLGFIVIARLAQRFHIGVELQPSPSGGIQALVRLPHDIVTDEEGQPLPIEAGAVATLTEAPAELEAATDEEPAEVEAAVDEAEEYEIVEEVVVEEVDDDYVEGDEYELVEEYVVEDYVDEEPVATEPVSLDEAVPEGDAFDRGLESLISGETAPGPIEDVSEPEPEPEPEPVAVAPAVDTRPPAEAPPTGADITAAGLVKRTPKKQSNTAVGTGPLRTASTSQRPTGSTQRSPEEVRAMLSRYRGGLKRGREPGDEPTSGT